MLTPCGGENRIGGKAMFCFLAFPYSFHIQFTHHDVIAMCDTDCDTMQALVHMQKQGLSDILP